MITYGNEKKVLDIVLSDSLGCKLCLECPSEDVLVFSFIFLWSFTCPMTGHKEAFFRSVGRVQARMRCCQLGSWDLL